ncbi:MAG: pyridoxal phosphate-dependent aminotransferase [Planctomycetota bacterium]
MALSEVPYIRWAKYEGLMGRHRLTASAVPPVEWSDIGLDPGSLALTEYSPYGPEEVFQRLHSDWRLDPGGIVLGASASHAHFCFAASMVPQGGTVVHESPGYLPLLDALSLLGVRKVPVQRRFEENYRLDPAELQQKIEAEKADLVLLTHLHNPSGVSLGEEEITGLVEVVEKTGCPVIIDEMYRPFLDPDPGPICLRHPKIVSVWGLNKVHGLPQVRFGWGCGSPQLADQARRIFDSTTLHTSCLTDQVARAAMDHLDVLAARGRRISKRGWTQFSEWLKNHDLPLIEPSGGLTCFPRIPLSVARDGDHFRELCMERDLNVTPGRFFGEPHHVRIGFGAPEEELKVSLKILGEILDTGRGPTSGA